MRRQRQDGARTLVGRQAREKPVCGVAMRRERVALDAPAVIPDLMAVRETAAKGGPLGALAATAQHHMPARDDRLRATGFGLPIQREHAAIETAFDGQCPGEGLAARLREHPEAKLLDEGALAR